MYSIEKKRAVFHQNVIITFPKKLAAGGVRITEKVVYCHMLLIFRLELVITELRIE